MSLFVGVIEGENKNKTRGTRGSLGRMKGAMIDSSEMSLMALEMKTVETADRSRGDGSPTDVVY